MDERIMIFLDGSNFYHGMKELARRTPISSAPLDFFKLSRTLAKNRKLIRTYYYMALHTERDNPERWRKQQNFLVHLQETAYLALRTKPLIRRGGTLMEKGIDVMLAVDLMRFGRLNSYDTAILVTGDADFVEAVRDVQDMGKQVELAHFPFGTASSLRTVCDKSVEMTATLLNICSTKKLMPEMAVVGK